MPPVRVAAVNRAESVYRSAAGKGANMVRCLRTLGIDAHLLAYAGGDIGEKFVEAYKAEKLTATFVRTAGETRVCTTLVEPGGTATELIEPAPKASESEGAEFDRHFERLIGDADMLAIGGTALGGIPEGTYLRYVESAKARGLRVFLDSYRSHGKRALEGSPDILKINSEELADLTHLPVLSARDRLEACSKIRETYNVRWIIITRGVDGAEAYGESAHFSAAAPEVRVANPIGSGDAFSAGVISAFNGQEAEPQNMKIALTRGVAMGTANCLNIKTGYVDIDDYVSVEKKVTVSGDTHPNDESR